MSDTSTPPTPTPGSPEALYEQIEEGLRSYWNPDGVDGQVDETVVPAPPDPDGAPQDPTDASVSPGADQGGDGSATSVTPPGQPAEEPAGGFVEPDLPVEPVAAPDPADGIVPAGGPLSPPGDAAGSGADSSPPDPAGTPPTTQQQTVDATAMLTDYLGRPPSVDEVAYLISVGSALNNLTQEQSAQIAAVMNGTPAPATSSPPQQVVAPPAAIPPPAGVDPSDPFAEPPDPQVAELQRQLAEVQSFQQQQALQVAHQQQQEAVAQMAAGAQDFKATAPYPMTDPELQVLEIKARDAGYYQINLQHGMDPRTAWAKACEQTMWSDPVYRQRVVDAQTAAAAEQLATDQARQRAASSVAAGGGVSPLTTQPVAGQQMTREQHLAAATEEARVAMSGGETG